MSLEQEKGRWRGGVGVTVRRRSGELRGPRTLGWRPEGAEEDGAARDEDGEMRGPGMLSWKPEEIRDEMGKGKGEEREGNREGLLSKMTVELGPRFIGAVEKERPVVGMTFQVAAVRKALASVWRICRAGNIVQFGEEPGECFIKHKGTGRKILLEKKRGSYVLAVEFVRRRGGESEGWESMGEECVTIDSGAEESVCPLEWGGGVRDEGRCTGERDEDGERRRGGEGAR